jgi:hypothetical protein
MKNKIEVFLNNEYGYRTYTWTLDMSEQDFVNWWKNLTDSDIIKYYFNLKALPGKLKRNSPAIIGDAKIRVAGDPKDKTPYLYCHLNDVGDSFICIGDEKIPHVKTYKRDWKEYWIDYQIKNQKEETVEG